MTYDCRLAYSVFRKPTHPSNSIWISDALLAGTIQRFTHLHLRYGSAVPGPLEARRRATRRKTASFAATEGGGAPIEVGALFGSGKKVEWWNVPNPSEPQVEVTESTALDYITYPFILTTRSNLNIAFLAHAEKTHPTEQCHLPRAIVA